MRGVDTRRARANEDVVTLSDWEGYFEAGRQTASPGRCQILLSSGIGRSDAERSKKR